MSEEFIATYTALVETLKATYKIDDIQNPPITKECKDFAAVFRSNLRPYLDKIKNRDPTIMLDGIPSLNALKIPQLWVGDSMTPKSKEYIWQYLQQLYDATDFVSQMSDKLTEATDPKKMISSLTQIITSPNMQRFTKKIMENQKQNTIPDKTQIADILNSITKNIDIDAVQEMFKDINPEQMLKNLDLNQLLSSFQKRGGTDDVD